MPKKKKRVPLGESPTSLGSLGDVLKQAGFNESDLTDEPAENDTREVAESDQFLLSKIIIQKQRKGRSGKIVTVIDGIELDESGLICIAKKMRKSLGCGSHVENGCIVLQGDLVERVQKWLNKECK